ncbi:MAG: hypothetical protein V2I57_07815 [Xanthomonadales bacterium]|jgi:hypothetical protein|nr:hypothetical protein [Xanthomonadales bacterium]
MRSKEASVDRPGWTTAALVCLAFIAGPFGVTPLVLHSANQLNFNVGLTWAMVGPAGLALLVFVVLTPLARLSTRFAALVLGAAVMFWVQGHVLVWDYGVLDGRAIDWGDRAWRGALDGVLWLAVILGAAAFASRLRPYLATLSLALLAIYAVTAIGSLATRTPAPAFHHYTLDETHQFDFSSQQNVILVVLDAFQSDVFQELLDTRSDLFDAFDGFTFYRNASAGFAKTYASIPLMFTGEWYDNSEPITAFVERSFLEHSVSTELVNSGWRVDLFPDIPRVVHHDERVASNVVARNDPVLVAEDSGRLADLSLFRVSPHFLKRFWLNDDQWRLSAAWSSRAREHANPTTLRQVDHPNGAARFALSALEFGRVAWDEPAFKFYHLMVPHEPFLLREDFSVERWPAGREGFTGQSAATVRVLESLIRALASLGIDDRTSLVVVADHGGGDYNAGVRLGDVVPAPDPSASPAMSEQYHASALPLVLVRPAGATGPLSISDDPVSIGDVAATLAREAGLPGARANAIGDGRDPGGASAERRYYFYRHQGWEGDYLPPMEEFVVTGHSWDIDAWASTGRVIAPGGVIERIQGLSAEERVRFDGQGLASTWLREGWSGAEPSGTWSAAPRASLQIPLDLHSSAPPPTHIHFWLTPFLAGGQLEAQRLRLSEFTGTPTASEATELASWSVRSRGCFSAVLPAGWHETGALKLQLDLPDAAAPNDFGLSGDFRLLGVRLTAMEIGPARTAPLSTDLGRLPESQLECAVQGSGWDREGESFVSTKSRARLQLTLPDTIPEGTAAIEVTAEILPFLGEGRIAAQRVSVSVAGEVLDERTVAAAESWTLRVPHDPGRRRLDLEFEFPDAATPKSLGMNVDGRALAVRLNHLTLEAR